MHIFSPILSNGSFMAWYSYEEYSHCASVTKFISYKPHSIEKSVHQGYGLRWGLKDWFQTLNSGQYKENLDLMSKSYQFMVSKGEFSYFLGFEGSYESLIPFNFLSLIFC